MDAALPYTYTLQSFQGAEKPFNLFLPGFKDDAKEENTLQRGSNFSSPIEKSAALKWVTWFHLPPIWPLGMGLIQMTAKFIAICMIPQIQMARA